MNFATGASLVQISWINIILSGDNAMVIALACRSLSNRERQLGIVLGASAAVALRVAFTVGLSEILFLPFARAIAGVLLLVIAVKLLIGDESSGTITGHDSFFRAMWTIAAADVVMSLDNVVAIAAAANGSWTLIIFGLAISVPIVVAGSTLIVALIQRFPLIVGIGSAFLGWIAGETVLQDSMLQDTLIGPLPDAVGGIAGAILVLVLGGGWLLWQRRSKDDAAASGDANRPFGPNDRP
jgi:YjbE family integral membrane protein